VSASAGEFRLRRDGTTRAVLTDAGAIESVLIEHARSFRKAPSMKYLRPVFGNGILTSDGEHWRRHRRLMQPAFTRQNIERYAEVMVRRTSAAVDAWLAEGVIETLPRIRRLALGIALETLFGTEIIERDARQLGFGVQVASAQLQRRVTSRVGFVLALLPTPGNLRTLLAIRRLNGLVDRMLRDRRRGGGERHDLLSLLEAATDPEEGTMTAAELRDEVNTLLIAGHETTALALTWTLYEVASHPAVDAQLAAEVERVLGRDRSATATDFNELPVTTNIVKEALRLYPPIHSIARQALDDIEIGGQPLKKGSRLRVSMLNQQRDERAYTNPDEFQPERWHDGLERRLPRGYYFPFSMGPRMCIGSTFATMELVLALATIRQRCRLELTSAERPRAVAMVGLHPDRPIRLRLVPEVAAGRSGSSTSA
jgi:cytochrome P450